MNTLPGFIDPIISINPRKPPSAIIRNSPALDRIGESVCRATRARTGNCAAYTFHGARD